jgi:hypothetical protein
MALHAVGAEGTTSETSVADLSLEVARLALGVEEAPHAHADTVVNLSDRGVTPEEIPRMYDHSVVVAELPQDAEAELLTGKKASEIVIALGERLGELRERAA